jgi:large repetitive protein
VKVSDPAHGTLTLNADGSYTYKPNDNYNGPDSFTYMANDGDLDSNVATVNITVNAVNDAPVAVDDIKTTPEDTPVEILASDLFQNDSTGPTNESGQTLRISAVSGATNGQAELNGAGNVLFTPATNFNGLASFDYTVCDNGTPEKCHEGTATVLVTVSAVNDAPVAEAQLVTTDEDMAKDITLGASDVENDTLSYTRVSEPAHGTLSGLGANLTYRPDPNYNGPDSFTFKANDGELDSNDATVDITVNVVNDAPEAVDDSYSTDVDTALNVAVPGVLANDKDLDGDSFTAELVSGPSHGQLTLNANGSFTYSPNANYSGPDSFTYRANDGKTASNTATVSITVKPRVDTTAPTVDNVNPSGQAGVSTTTEITVTFSEAMDESTLNDNTVNLVKPGKKPTSIPVTMTTTTDGSGRSVLTLNPFGSAKQNLAANTTYQLTIEGAGDGDNFAVKDLAGIELARDEVSSFTTARK